MLVACRTRGERLLADRGWLSRRAKEAARTRLPPLPRVLPLTAPPLLAFLQHFGPSCPRIAFQNFMTHPLKLEEKLSVVNNAPNGGNETLLP